MFFKRRKTCLFLVVVLQHGHEMSKDLYGTYVHIQILCFSFNPLFGDLLVAVVVRRGLLSFLVWTVRKGKKAWKLKRIKNDLFLNGNNVKEFSNENARHFKYVKETTPVVD